MLRRAGPGDAAAVRALTRAAYAKWVPVIGREPWPMTADYERAVREHRIDLAMLDGGLAALIETVAQPDHLLVENLAVDPSFQGRGLGASLLRHAEVLAAAAGTPMLRLYTNARFTENLAFYARRGFAEDRREPIADGIVVHMAKALA